MKIYLASTAPGHENESYFISYIRRRLLSYYHIMDNQFYSKYIYIYIYVNIEA